MNKTIAMIALLPLTACQQSPPPANRADVLAPTQAPPAQQTVSAANEAQPVVPTPPPEATSPADPKSAQAAGQVVRQYAALVEQKHFAEAAKLWSDPAAAKAAADELKIYAKVEMTVGQPGGMEGAAGSSYVDVPIVLNGRLQSSGIRHREGTAIVRRVNDVPGSTEAQRRWHIERIDWKF